MSTHAGLVVSYNYSLVALSIFIAILAAYAALDLSGRVTAARGFRRLAWLGGGAIAMGSGIWAMHYVGMEAFSLSVPILYDWPTVLLSLLCAVLASGTALLIVSQSTMGLYRKIIGSVVMGSGIAAMHYTGMAAMRLQAMCVYSSGLVILSISLAIAISYIALRTAFVFKADLSSWSLRKTGGALVLGAAIPVTHYSGMAAVTFMPAASVEGSLRHAVNVSNINLACIVLITLVLLTIVFVSASVHRHLIEHGKQFEDNLLQLQAVFDSMTDAIIVADFETKTLLHNQAAVRLLKVDKKLISFEEAGNSFEIFLPDGAPISMEQSPLIRAAHGDYCTNLEMMFRRKDDSISVTTEMTTVPLVDLLSKSSKVILSIRNIGERRILDETRTRLASIVESSEDAIIGKTYEGIVTSWNRGAEKIFGYTAKEMVGQSILRLFLPDQIDEETEILRRLRLGEFVDHLETVRVRKDGRTINVSLTISPIRDADGKVIGGSIIARDITDRKKLESQLLLSQKMDAVGQLTGGIAHDFNNLLSIIIGNLDLLERQVSADVSAHQRVLTAQKAALRGADLTRRLLAFSSNESLSPVPTNVHHLIHNMIEMTDRVIGPEIKIATHLDESISEILVDAAGFESVLINLMVNARDAMPNGGTITITTNYCNLEHAYPPVQAGELKPGRYACVSVSDNGHGMSRQTLEHVFEPFFTTKPQGKGTGLGLAMVYGFMKQSHGTVRIYSELNYGTTVTLYLPVDEVRSLPTTEVVEPNITFTATATVLIVDDELDLLDIATAYLADMGWKAYTAVDGHDALEVIQREKDIDLMVTDIVMPGGMDGVELAHKVRLHNPNIKIIYCSGFPADALAEHGMPLVDGPLLHKPYQRNEFSTMLRRVMAKETQANQGPTI